MLNIVYSSRTGFTIYSFPSEKKKVGFKLYITSLIEHIFMRLVSFANFISFFKKSCAKTEAYLGIRQMEIFWQNNMP